MRIFIYNFLLELFYILIGAILILAGLEMVWPGLVLAYFNLNWLLIFWLIIGIMVVL